MRHPLLLSLLLFPLRVLSSCNKNPVTGSACSSDHVIIGPTGASMTAGTCSDGTCVCSPPYTAGLSCDRVISAYGPPRPGPDLYVNQWRYLSKTCWGPQMTGTITVDINWKNVMCTNLSGTCSTLSYPSVGAIPKPKIFFYSNFDNSFARAVLTSNTASVYDSTTLLDSSTGNPLCEGIGSTSNTPACDSNYVSPSLKFETCKLKKTYFLRNLINESILVFLVVSKCNSVGTVDWTVSVAPTSSPGVCSVCGGTEAAKGLRCFSDAGGNCMTQSANQPAMVFTPQKKISKAVVVIAAVVFSGAMLFGFLLLKYYQRRVKARRHRQGIAQLQRNHHTCIESETVQSRGATLAREHYSITGGS